MGSLGDNAGAFSLAVSCLQVQLQKPHAGTCVPCSVVNALRHFGVHAPVDQVIEAMRMQRLHGRDGSTTVKAAMYLRREYGMDVRKSAPHLTIWNPMEATIETAWRFEAMLMDGYVGILRRREKKGVGHDVVLHRVIWDHGEPAFVCYDSNKLHTAGHWTYQAIDYVWFVSEDTSMTEWLAMSELKQKSLSPAPTGRVGYFVRPGKLGVLRPAPKRSPFRSRRQFWAPVQTEADSLPEG